jgi:hypothetical protein
MSTWRHDERDDLDSEIDGKWRKASREEPPPHVDAAILAAARTRRSRFATWQPLAMAAAVAGLAFLLVQLLPREPDVEQPILMEPVPPPAAPVEPAESGASRSDAAPGPRQLSKESRANAEPAAGAPAPAPAAERAAARAESSSLDAPTAEMPPAQWAALIETLYASGDRATAAAQLRAFRVEHADADRYLPEALREWASEVR